MHRTIGQTVAPHRDKEVDRGRHQRARFYSGLLSVLSGLGYIFYLQIIQLNASLPKYQQILTEHATAIADELQSRFQSLPPDWSSESATCFPKVTEWGSVVAGKLLGAFIGSFKSVSTWVFNFTIAIILAYFLSLEFINWNKLASERSPKTLRIAFEFLRTNVFKGIASYLKAQGILISVTFVVVFASLLMLGVGNAFAISLLAALFDILPLLGIQTLFIPWIIYLFIVGDKYWPYG